MDRLNPTSPRVGALHIGDWAVHPATGQIMRDGETLRLEARSMRLLLCLAERAGQVVSIDDLLTHVWPDVTVSPDSVYQAVASLRRQLSDDPRQPAYIATVPRLGYQMIAPVSPISDSQLNSASTSIIPPSSAPALSEPPRRRTGLLLFVLTFVLCAIVLISLFSRGPSPRKTSAASAVAPVPQQPSIAVLPFLDLTPGMHEEEFADGMTEELIDRIAKVPGLHVPPPTSSFVYKGKQVPVADIARTLGVIYVLDGSVRKDGTWIRVATRLVRADSGFVLWSETYDRPFKDILSIQDDIATAVTKALTQSIAATLDHIEPKE
jgi:transcriptional activator of cad operon